VKVVRASSNAIGGNSSSTPRWNDVPRGTMDEVSSHVRLDLPMDAGKAAQEIVPPRSRIPSWKGLRADSEEKHVLASDVDAVEVDSLKRLTPTGRLEKRTFADDVQETKEIPSALF
jgi:hypothetical protein